MSLHYPQWHCSETTITGSQVLSKHVSRLAGLPVSAGPRKSKYLFTLSRLPLIWTIQIDIPWSPV